MNVLLRANHGRWLVDCPSDVCRAAVLFAGDLLMTCDCRDANVCEHEGVCRQTMTVVVPDELAEIDRVLSLRPMRENRNWTPGETVRDLKRENVTHGVRI